MSEIIDINVIKIEEIVDIIANFEHLNIEINSSQDINNLQINATPNVVQVNVNVIPLVQTPTFANVLNEGNATAGNDIIISDGDQIQFDNYSRIRKGITDAGNGGAKGVALVCSIDYELKWEAGRLYTMQQDGFTIREVSHNFTLTPSATDDDTKGFVIDSRWILDNGDVYVCTDATENNAVWQLTTLTYTPEDASNKSTSVITDQSSDVKYPSVKSVFDWANGAFTTASAVASQITSALTGYATQSWVNSQGFITNVITALGYTPANKAGETFTGSISATNLSGTNTGDNATNTQYSGLATSKENASNKSTTITGNEASNTLFPTIKSVVDWVTALFIRRATNTTNYVQKVTGAGTIGDSQIFDNGTFVGLNTTTNTGFKLDVNGTSIYRDVLTIKKTGNSAGIILEETTLGYYSPNIMFRGLGSGIYGTIGIDYLNLVISSQSNRYVGFGSIGQPGDYAVTINPYAYGVNAFPNNFIQRITQTANNAVGLVIKNNTTQSPIPTANFLEFRNASNVVLSAVTPSGAFIIGTATDVPSAILNVASTSKGFLPPRMTNAQRLAIASPAIGLMVYCTDMVEGLYINKSTGWTFII
jgi:hypothetical protein